MAILTAHAAVAGWTVRSHAADTTGADQAAEGQKLFAKHCAKCHGDAEVAKSLGEAGATCADCHEQTRWK